MYLLSIIIPVYNVEPYIKRCLDSILVQLDSRMEIIIVNDGSTDKSGEICNEYASKYDAIKVIHENNRGVSAARNQGLKMAKGEYISWVDPDDYLDSEWGISILPTLEEQSVDILIYDYVLLKHNFEKIWSYRNEDCKLEKEQLLKDIGEDQIIQSQLWHKIIRRELYKNIKFPEDITCMEDFAVIHLLIEKAQTLYYMHKPLYYYVYRECSLVTEINLEKSYQCCLVAHDRYVYLKRLGYESSVIGYISQVLGFMIQYFMVNSSIKLEYKYRYMDLKKELNRYYDKINKLETVDWKFRVKCKLVQLNLLEVAVRVKQLKEKYL
ncbi:glycosyltransferase family 2 protein [Veillonella intestinalis]|uniref:glycosyltransferase family 2 protein n=1 Tax=Veillonella intestinalis TaxID=2941341 RepID=UPI00203F34DB|nr:glycosyltransferase family 2 protein [Veillonella intestinalis]